MCADVKKTRLLQVFGSKKVVKLPEWLVIVASASDIMQAGSNSKRELLHRGGRSNACTHSPSGCRYLVQRRRRHLALSGTVGGMTPSYRQHITFRPMVQQTPLDALRLTDVLAASLVHVGEVQPSIKRFAGTDY